MDDLRTTDPGQHAAVTAMIPFAEGKPCVNVVERDGAVFVCRRISGLRLAPEFGELLGQCEWADPPEARPEELTDGMAIAWDRVGLQLGPGWWYDSYSGWFFVYDPALVSRSLEGDHSWVPPFLARFHSREAEPGTAPDPADI